ncbi:Surp module [Saitoella complicata NRRL Y-17804]|uniref:Surp module n=1 Tax=Saitoella complicata (strain BCRC 22490 / CBS 7301 / JCM 7358 / NBRC 10748 / NRRL Y-17804) TaxID=698492 RepID=UPI0008672326|nr:Surp module [Saitoella complicata NRRL Y-17804]ODQ50471.1 Surp module [Saitoella complicata NRRL Y-17804]
MSPTPPIPSPSNTALKKTQYPPGVILPPPDIRDIVEKTATYVARSGPAFESRIRDTEKHNSKFAFLNPADPYYPYYAHRLSEIQSGSTAGSGLNPDRESRLRTSAAAKDVEAKERQLDDAPEAPPAYKFSAKLPAISAQDLDILRLTAQFVARKGRGFQSSLANREARNFQFDFLRPNHSLHPYFLALVEQYTQILIPPTPHPTIELQKNVEDVYALLPRIQSRVNWSKHQASQQKRQAEEDEKERIAYAAVDWQDFVVVETVLFTDADENAELALPVSLNDLQSATLEEKARMRGETLAIEDVPVQEEEEEVAIPVPAPAVAEIDEEAQFIQQRMHQREQARLAHQTATTLPPNMKIRPSTHDPRTRTPHPSQIATQLCPRCNAPIPVDEMAEHMRIELLDPRWRAQRSVAESREVGTSNLYVEDVVRNVKRVMRGEEGEGVRKKQREA